MTTDTAAVLSREYPVGRYRVTFTSPALAPGAVLAMTAEWSPRVPPKLSARERAAYQTARDAFLCELMSGAG